MTDRINYNSPHKPSAYYFRSLDTSTNSTTNIQQLISRLSQSYQSSNSEQINTILDNRRNKLVQLRKMRSKYILQNPMIPASSTQRFSYVKPITSEEKYLDQKKRLNILIPERAYNDQPNIKAGSLDRSKMMSYESNYDPRVVSKKFQEFIRLVEDQSGEMKKKRLQSLTKSKEQILPKIKLHKKVSMKNTYFKRFVSDQYNFYKPPIKDISRVQKMFDQSSNRKSTDRSRTIEGQSSRQSSPRAHHTLEINSDYGDAQKKLQLVFKTLDPYKNA